MPTADTGSRVVAWRSFNSANPGFSMFSNESPLPGQGTVYVNLDQLINVATPNPEDRNKKSTYNNFIVIMHEIGHAKQFIDNPSWFRLKEGTGDYVKHPKDKVLAALAKVSGKAWGIDAKANRILGMPAKSFSSAIEWENYIYHEGPICDEVGLARRICYDNISGAFGDTSIGGGIGR